MSAQDQISEAIRNGENIILSYKFDPGWKRLQEENGFESPRPSPLLKTLPRKSFTYIDVNNSTEVLDRIMDICEEGKEASLTSLFDRVYVHCPEMGDMSPFLESFVAKRGDAISSIFNGFCVDEPHVSKIKNRQFVENFLARTTDSGSKVDPRDIRAIAGPRTFLFSPTDGTRYSKNPNKLLFDNGVLIGDDPDMEGEILCRLALDVRDPQLRGLLRMPGEKLVTIVPYIRHHEASLGLERALQDGEDHKSYVVQGKVDNINQICMRRLPHATLSELLR